MDFQKEKDAFFLSTFPNIFHSRQTITFSVPKHFLFEENHVLFCWFWHCLFDKDLWAIYGWGSFSYCTYIFLIECIFAKQIFLVQGNTYSSLFLEAFQKDVAFLFWSFCLCLSTFQNIFHSWQTILDRMYYPILVILLFYF